ncbi:hypothetical protein FDECE_16791 [Fusarium decemcellulare]|nr:hypothetical protein FDECE_16791 [Fusarium decemcellulare]
MDVFFAITTPMHYGYSARSAAYTPISTRSVTDQPPHQQLLANVPNERIPGENQVELSSRQAAQTFTNKNKAQALPTHGDTTDNPPQGLNNDSFISSYTSETK